MIKRLILIQLLFLFTVITMKPASSQTMAAHDSWKKLWYVNTVWYQIFPDRFYIAEKQTGPFISERYDRRGNLIEIEPSSWEKAPPTTTNKYGGTLQGIRAKASYLKDLGISGLWLNPIFAATSNHRYNTSDYRKIDPILGKKEDLCELVNTLHKDHIRIILDGVFNHTGYEFWAFQDIIRNGKESAYKDWYHIKGYPVSKIWMLGRGKHPNYECWWGVPSLPKLNYSSKEVRKHIYDITRIWMACGIDGWRLDVPEEIKCDEFWKEWRAVVKSAKSDAYISGEIWGEGSQWINNGDRFDGLMNYYGFREPAMHYFSSHRIKVSQFDKMLADRRGRHPHHVNCALQNLLSSHDTARILSVIHNRDDKDSDKEKKGYYRGPVGEDTIKRFKVAVLFQMTYVGCPMIYYGDEIGMEGGKDPDCRRTMIWAPEKQNRELLDWHKNLIRIRNEHQALRTGDFRTVLTDDLHDVYAYERSEKDESIITLFNYSGEAAEVSLPMNGSAYDLLHNGELKAGSDGRLAMTLAPWSGRILLQKTK